MFHYTSPDGISIDGDAMQALKIASDRFVTNGKNLRDFTVTLSVEAGKNCDAGEIFMVTFIGKLTSGKRGLGTANRVPGSITYYISKEKWEIIKEQGIK